ncbi:inorganic phosphate transporter [Glutamicibacter protophormiae]|uniref:inorganic phosphate transporter n=1 Tax=Kocuria TaxID=57493 RepID=UPI0006D77E56|nr:MULTISPECIES: inorganic phosphate transporter [Kocuria]MDN5631713.1 inorganic phosphate transporter [Kocuria sp.]RUP83998.1 inorganic phosphate transporter [Kocuria sp. HSID17590]RUQ07670.1 inorganic phosphate transporter [Kocuria sp. HSID17582]WNB87956.1 inorganic phosphate transporter [Glutamicibacter protophormiae]
MTELLALLGILLTLVFTVVNGFHDASNAVALPVRFNALTPRVALWLGAVFNLVGALLVGLVLNRMITFEIPVPLDVVGVVALLCSLVTAIGWDLATWWWRMPSSSTAAIGGAVVGALLGARAVGLLHGPLPVGPYLSWNVLVPLVVSPVVAFAAAYLLVPPLVHLVRHETPGRVNFRSGVVQATGAAAIHFGHGIQHARRTLWILMVLMLVLGSGFSRGSIPVWLVLLVGLCLGFGTLLGGWRIAYTLSSRVVTLDPLRGAIAQTVSGALLFVGGFLSPIPLSTSQTSTGAILGAGSAQKFRTVYHQTVVRLLLTWIVTAPVCGLVSGMLFLALSPLLPALP